MRILLCVVLSVTLSTAAFARSLTGNQIKQLLIGNTITGVQDNAPYSEYLDPQGTISGDSQGEIYFGRWQISRNEICFRYAGESKEWVCTGVTLKGSTIIWDDNTSATLVAGAR
jgi:hypothetical protein